MDAPPAAGPGVSRRLPRDIWVLIAAAFAIAIGYGLIAPVLPQFAAEFSVSVTATTVVVSAFAAFRLLWATPAGSLVSRFGERPVYMAGVLIVAASSALTAFAQNYWQLLIFRSLGGIGSVMFTVAAVALLVKLAPSHIRGKVSAAYGATFLIGSIAGPVLGGLLAGADNRLPFLVYAGTLVIAVIVIGALLPRTDATSRASGGVPPMTVREALHDRAYVASLTTAFVNGWSNFGIRVSLVPLFVAFTISPDPRMAGIVMAAFAIGNAAILPFSSRFADARGRRPLIIAGALLSAGFTASVGITSNLWELLVVSALAGAGAGAMNPAQQAALTDIVGTKRSAGQVISSYQMVTDVGAIVGPIAAGAMADAVGYGWAFGMTGALLVLGSLLWWSTPDTLRRASEG